MRATRGLRRPAAVWKLNRAVAVGEAGDVAGCPSHARATRALEGYPYTCLRKTPVSD